MGSGIAQVAATRGFRVGIKEIDQDAIEACQHRVDKLVDKYAVHKQLSVEKKTEVRGSIKVHDDFRVLESADCVIEAVTGFFSA